MTITLETKKAFDCATEKGAIWLNENFHKFSQYNKIKIALALLARAMPTQLEHSGEIKEAETKVIVVYANKSGANTNTESRISAA